MMGLDETNSAAQETPEETPEVTPEGNPPEPLLEVNPIDAAIAAVQAGDKEAYAQVVAAYHRRLRASLAAKCPSGVDPDEMAHIAFLEAYKRIDHFEVGTDFYVWVWVFARNTLLAELKKVKRRAQKTESYMDEALIDRIEEDLAGEAADGEPYLQTLRHCVSNLPEHSRELVNLRYTQDYSLSAVAKAVGKTVSALKFQMFSIRKALRDCVKKNLPAMELNDQPV